MRRQEARAALVAQIEEAARAELGEAGAAALSLRSVARRVGITPSALYRYFDGRDALLTALVTEAYDAIGETAEVAAARRGAPAQRWMTVGRAVRTWAVDHPHQWALVYGSPVPGYAAPQTTIAAAARLMVVLAGLVPDAAPAVSVPVERSLRPWLRDVGAPLMPGVREELVALAVYAYTQLIGAVSAELFGMYGSDAPPAAVFDHGLRVTAALLGLRS